MQHSKLAALLLAASIAIPSLALADSVAVVNGTPIDKSDVDQAISSITRNRIRRHCAKKSKTA